MAGAAKATAGEGAGPPRRGRRPRAARGGAVAAAARTVRPRNRAAPKEWRSSGSRERDQAVGGADVAWPLLPQAWSVPRPARRPYLARPGARPFDPAGPPAAILAGRGKASRRGGTRRA